MANSGTLPALAFTAAAAELGVVVGPAPIRVAAGLTLAFLPGLLITRAIHTQTRTEGAERFLLAPGMSLAVAVIAGLLLDIANIRLTTEHWAIALGLVTAAGLAGEAILEDEHEVAPDRRRSRGRLTAASPVRRYSPGIAPTVMLVMAALAVSAAVVIGVVGQHDRDSATEFTELWALSEPGSDSAVRLGVRSHERGVVHYRIRVLIDGQVARSQALTLRPGQTWQSTQPSTRSGGRVDVALLNSPGGAVYRRVHLTAG